MLVWFIYKPQYTLMFTKIEHTQLKAYVCWHIGQRIWSGCWSPASSSAGWPEWWLRRSLCSTSGALSLSAGTSSGTWVRLFTMQHMSTWFMYGEDHNDQHLTPEHCVPCELGVASRGSGGGHSIEFPHRFRIPKKSPETINFLLHNRMNNEHEE